MIYVLLALVAVIAVLVYLRYVGRRHVAALFRSTAERHLREGLDLRAALQRAANTFRSRFPFNRIADEELDFFIDVLQDLNFAIEVGAGILQTCEAKANISLLRDKAATLRSAYSADLRLGLLDLIAKAEAVKSKVTAQVPNLSVALLLALGQRADWHFEREENDSVYYLYRATEVKIPKESSGKDVAKLVLLTEVRRKSVTRGADHSYQTRLGERELVLQSFDSLFETVFSDVQTRPTPPL